MSDDDTQVDDAYGVQYEGLEGEYLETAMALGDVPGELRTDHECNPVIVYGHAGLSPAQGWRHVVMPDFTGLIATGTCGQCDKRAVLRVPDHLVFAAKLWRPVEEAT